MLNNICLAHWATTRQGENSMPANMTRNERRRLRRKAKPTAAIAPATFFDFGPGKAPKAVSEQRAMDALAKCIERLIVANFEPQVMRLSADVSAAFPRHDSAKTPPGSQPYLAVGMDTGGQPTYCLRDLAFPGIEDPVEERLLAEQVMLAALSKHTSYAGCVA